MKRLTSGDQRLSSRSWRVILTYITLVGVMAGVFGFSGAPARAAGSLPCDIYASNNTPCVAAHSVTRALFSSYNGRLYQIQRRSDNATLDIGTLSAGGIANAAAQDSFCSGTICYITKIYDQSSKGNNLTVEGPGGNGGQNSPANASSMPITLGGQKVYALYTTAGIGYRNDATSGIATNGQPEGMYMVTSGTYDTANCCFDYGNAEVSNTDTGNAHMDAVSLTTMCWFSPCTGSGPWVAADLENGLFAGGNGSNTNNLGNNTPFVTALLKNDGQHYTLKGGNAQSGGLTTWYSGALPTGYTPMHQEGAIVLGTGGDDSNYSAGLFTEGVMTAGYPSDAADNAVQANITAAGYSFSSSSPVRYALINRYSGFAMSSHWSYSQGANITQETYNSTWQSQKWNLIPTGDGHYEIVNYFSNMLLDVQGNSTTAGAPLIEWPSNNAYNQQWSLVSAGNGYYNIVSRSSGQVADDYGFSTTSGTNIVQWPSTGGTNQQWSLVQTS